jgi:hypothetical protein
MQLQGKYFESGATFVYGEQGLYKNKNYIAIISSC